MAKVFSVATLELRPGVRGEDFERFWIEQYAPMGTKLGWTAYIAKGDRGERAGKYAVIWEIPSVETRDRFAPADGVFTQELHDRLGPDFERLDKQLDTFIEGWPHTDYVEIEGRAVTAQRTTGD